MAVGSATPMTGTTTVNLIAQAQGYLGNTFTQLLPIVVPVAITLAALYAILHWVVGSGRRT